VKIGAAAWSTPVRPLSSLVSAKASSQKGMALLSAPRTSTTRSRPRSVDSPPPANGTRARRKSVPQRTRPNATADGSNASSPSLMKRNDDPQIAERRSRTPTSRRDTEATVVGRRRPRSRNAPGGDVLGSR
jgi:hypothetical protein